MPYTQQEVYHFEFSEQFYTRDNFTNSSRQVNQIHLKFGWRNLNTFSMLNCKAFYFSYNIIAMARRTICFAMKEAVNSIAHCLSCPRFDMFD